LSLELNRIYAEDCLKFMEGLEADKEQPFSVICTSPPYNLQKPYSKYKDDLKRTAYLAWMEQIADLSSKVLKDDGSFFLNFGGKPSDPWMAWDVAREFGRHYELQNIIHWVKHISIPQDSQVRSNDLNHDISFGHFKPINTNRYLNQCQEYIFHFTKHGDVKLDKLAIGVPYQHKSNVDRWKVKGQDKRDRGNVWFIRYTNKQGAFVKVLHPAEFPEKLPYLCIKLQGVRKDMTVYDPFMGIGNTALACLTLKVNYVGTEIDTKYIRIAQDSIERRQKELSQRELTVEVAETPKARLGNT
jgi:site-specific DNA-methyltransferase (adenine-specific)